MDDGRSPSGGADKQKGGKLGGKGGYVLDSRRSEAETTVGYITNNGRKIRIKTEIKKNKNDKYYSLYYYRI
jgi:hypothetical protein